MDVFFFRLEIHRNHNSFCSLGFVCLFSAFTFFSYSLVSECVCVCFFGMFGLRMSDERIFGSQNLTVGDFLFRLQIEFQENSRLIFIVRFVYFVVDSKIQGRKNVKELKYEKNTHTQCYHSITMKRKKNN